MAAAEISTHGCSLCENRFDLNSTCCCEVRPTTFEPVTDEKMLKRANLFPGDKLCEFHFDRVAKGMVFGLRNANYYCCAPFHVRSSRSQNLKRIPHNWESLFKNTAVDDARRYLTASHLCWECYKITIDVLQTRSQKSDEDSVFDEIKPWDVDFSPFLKQYVSPRQWLSTENLNQVSPGFSRRSRKRRSSHDVPPMVRRRLAYSGTNLSENAYSKSTSELHDWNSILVPKSIQRSRDDLTAENLNGPREISHVPGENIHPEDNPDDVMSSRVSDSGNETISEIPDGISDVASLTNEFVETTYDECSQLPSTQSSVCSVNTGVSIQLPLSSPIHDDVTAETTNNTEPFNAAINDKSKICNVSKLHVEISEKELQVESILEESNEEEDISLHGNAESVISNQHEVEKYPSNVESNKQNEISVNILPPPNLLLNNEQLKTHEFKHYSAKQQEPFSLDSYFGLKAESKENQHTPLSSQVQEPDLPGEVVIPLPVCYVNDGHDKTCDRILEQVSLTKLEPAVQVDKIDKEGHSEKRTSSKTFAKVNNVFSKTNESVEFAFDESQNILLTQPTFCLPNEETLVLPALSSNHELNNELYKATTSDEPVICSKSKPNVDDDVVVESLSNTNVPKAMRENTSLTARDKDEGIFMHSSTGNELNILPDRGEVDPNSVACTTRNEEAELPSETLLFQNSNSRNELLETYEFYSKEKQEPCSDSVANMHSAATHSHHHDLHVKIPHNIDIKNNAPAVNIAVEDAFTNKHDSPSVVGVIQKCYVNNDDDTAMTATQGVTLTQVQPCQCEPSLKQDKLLSNEPQSQHKKDNPTHLHLRHTDAGSKQQIIEGSYSEPKTSSSMAQLPNPTNVGRFVSRYFKYYYKDLEATLGRNAAFVQTFTSIIAGLLFAYACSVNF